MAKLIGNNPNQVPTNGDLGTLAFQDSDNVIVENLTVSGSSSKLVVEDNSTDAALRVTQTGTGNALVVEDSANPDSSSFVVNASGNVGIGEVSYDSKLQVGTAQFDPSLARTTAAIIVRSDTGSTTGDGEYSGAITFGKIDSSRPFGSIAGVQIGSDVDGGGLAFFTKNGTSTNDIVSERMRIDSSGNVGIGTSSPATALDVTGTVTASEVQSSGAIKASAPTARFDLLETDGQTGYNQIWQVLAANDLSIQHRDGSNGFLNNLYTCDLATTGVGGAITHRWNIGSGEAMRIDSSGNVGIGVTSISYQLQLSTDSAGKPSTTTWTVVSDERIKENIELADLDLCYEAVKNIPLKRFKWRDDVYSEEQVADRHKLGWIAQDVETVYPKAVNIHEFKYNQVYSDVIIPAVEEELDEDGNVITEAQEERIEKELVSEDVIEDCRNLNADQIYAAMFGAIQKLIQKVETLETRIAQLEA